jgi:UDP-GlcNAc:undecaprenyl-phosphate/decaprenyl-phosphate GlcNAc-1-phosphate transferase
MTELRGWEYLVVFVVTAGSTLLLTPLALGFARRHAVLDHPSEIKAQADPVPYLGGAAIVIVFAVVIGAAALLKSDVRNRSDLLILLGLATLLAIVGLIDDLRQLGPVVRLGIEIAAAVVVLQTEQAELFGNPYLDVPITVLWIVGVTNAVNFLDNMDGLSGGVSAIAAFSFFVIAATNGQFLVAVLSIALCGCAAGFLRENFHPARIYMGDAGALFIGFMLANIGLRLRFDGPTQLTFFVPILVLGVPLFDTTLIVVNRLLHRRNPAVGGRDHTSHRLVFVGIPVPVAVGLIYAGALSLGWLAVVMANVERTTGFVLMGWVLSIAVFLGVLISAVPVYETSRRRHLMIQEVLRHEQEPPATVDSAGAPPVEAGGPEAIDEAS